MNERNKERFGYILTIVLTFSIAFYIGLSIGYDKGQERLNDQNMAFWLSQESESQYNYEVMRDLFTTSGINDTVTIEFYDWVDWEYVCWVNHSKVCQSYFFPNQYSYKVMIPSPGKLKVIGE